MDKMCGKYFDDIMEVDVWVLWIRVLGVVGCWFWISVYGFEG